MSRKNIALLSLGLILIATSVWQIRAAQSDLSIISLPSANPPVTIITPSNIQTTRPTVLIAHGFAGSAILMRGFALTLAHAGYTTISWDFEGHGYNPQPFEVDSGFNNMLKDAESAMTTTEKVVPIDPRHLAILGHSMGSGVALTYGMSFPDTNATIAVSPVIHTVSTSLPRNLLLMAGSLETQFAGNADQLLSDAGGQGGEFSNGSARKLVIIPNVEHISILFSPTSQRTARLWLDDVFGIQVGATDHVDRRLLWFSLGVFGSILLGSSSLNLLRSPISSESISKSSWLKLLSVLGGGIASSLLLWLIGQFGINLSQTFGLLVGGYLLLWFGLAGTIGLLIYRPKIAKPTLIELIKAFLAFAVLWLGVGLLGNNVWLPWLLIPYRLMLWIPGSILLFPWFLLIASSIKHSKSLTLFGWWVFQSFTIIFSLYLALRLTPELGFLFIVLPLVPIMIGLHMLAVSPKHGSWAYAISGAMFIAWLILAVFPLH